MESNWYWACPRSEPAGDNFIIENGQDALWSRVRAEIDMDEKCMWHKVHKNDQGEQLEDILDMMLTVVPHYRVNQNKFVFEAAKIPVFAKFLYNARADLCNYVSNSLYPEHKSLVETYSEDNMRQLGSIVSKTLGCDENWY